jgi:hypothetical protein
MKGDPNADIHPWRKRPLVPSDCSFISLNQELNKLCHGYRAQADACANRSQ